MRYSSGTMPTSKGYTGQYADAASSGLDYYNARYYDPLVGQFTSADTAGDGLNRYAYVADDPETNTDPTGQVCTPMDDPMGARCGVSGGGGGCTTNCGGTPPCIASCQSPCWPHCSPPKRPPTGPGSPCGGCKQTTGGSGGPTPQQLQKLRADAYGAYSQYQDLIDLLNKILDGLKWITDRIPPGIVLLGGLEAGLNLGISELQLLQTLYVGQANWDPSQWTAFNIFEFSGTIAVVTGALSVLLTSVAVEVAQLPGELAAAVAEDCPICAAVIATVGATLNDADMVGWLGTLAVVNFTASAIAANTTGKELEDASNG